MNRLVVVENPKLWPLTLEGAEVVPARVYLVDPRFSEMRRATVFNLCRDYGYQSLGYYVSLLAAARGHRPLPSVATLQDLGSGPLLRIFTEELDEIIQRSLAPLKSTEFDLRVYFGRNVAQRYDRLSRGLFNFFPAPFLHARFLKAERWRLTSIRPIAGQDVPESHREFLTDQARLFFARARTRARERRVYRYDLAILWREDDPEPPSEERAIKRFVKAARHHGIDAEVISPQDFGRLGEYDALFIRETTAVNHRTYRFARRASAEGIVVIDDPQSIIRCSNKVYQAELLARHEVPCPPTLVVHAGNVGEVAGAIGFPCVLKKPDAAFSLGVTKVAREEDLQAALAEALRTSALVIAQGWVPTDFDWRIGVLGRQALFACRYHMVPGHWQIARGGAAGRRQYGRVEAVPFDSVPPAVLDAGVRAASLIGDGLYGVDVKDVGGRPMVIEVNDNPNIDAGNEDGVLGDELYLRVMQHFRERLDARGAPGASP